MAHPDLDGYARYRQRRNAGDNDRLQAEELKAWKTTEMVKPALAYYRELHDAETRLNRLSRGTSLYGDDTEYFLSQALTTQNTDQQRDFARYLHAQWNEQRKALDKRQRERFRKDIDAQLPRHRKLFGRSEPDPHKAFLARRKVVFAYINEHKALNQQSPPRGPQSRHRHAG